MKLELHPEAVKNFNNKSTILLDELSTKIRSIPQNFKTHLSLIFLFLILLVETT